MLRLFALLVLALAGTISGPLMAQAKIPLSALEQGGVLSLAPVLAKVSPSVVSVLAWNRGSDAPKTADRNRRASGTRAQAVDANAGSGVIFDAARGLIITNNHVVEHSDQIAVTLIHGRRLPATLVGADPNTDLAVIKVPPEDLTELSFSDSDGLEMGDFVIVIGVPVPIGRTMTSGIVSGLHRSNIGLAHAEDFIQTDAAIYPGDSGGALVNLRGELVGIAAGYVGQSSANSEVGFAIPSNLARRVAEQIVAHGGVHRGTLGITIADPRLVSTEEIKSAVPRPVIDKVDAGSAAERAGLKKGDVVMAIDGKPVWEAKSIERKLDLDWVGDTVAFTVLRNGQPTVVRATIEDPGHPRSK
jgi:serine protease DegQ